MGGSGDLRGDAHRRPQRTCVGCRTVSPKDELVRIVRDPAGEVRVDIGGRAPGRGAYLHRRVACLRAAARGGRLTGALRTRLGEAQTASLIRGLTDVVGETG